MGMIGDDDDGGDWTHPPTKSSPWAGMRSRDIFGSWGW